jgi:hypothetical protein
MSLVPLAPFYFLLSFVLVDLSASPGSGAAGERDLEQLQGAWGRARPDFVDELFADKVRK